MNTIIGTDIIEAKELLEKDEVVAIPTETVYGLAGNALSEKAIAKIFEVKNRPQFNPLIMHIYSTDEIKKYTYADDEVLAFAKQFMPGPLTMLLKKKNSVPDLLTAGSDKVAIRIPKHPLTLQLLQSLDFPLAAPSANPSGYVSPVTAEHVLQGLKGKIPYILNGGACVVGVESTIVELQNDKLIVHRLGGMSVEEIQSKTDLPVVLQTHDERPQTSGKMKSHYATKTPLIMGDVNSLLQEYKSKKIALLSLKPSDIHQSNVTIFPLSETGNLTEAASKLFSTMRNIDEQSFDIIITEHFPDKGLGRAINDRLSRAQYIYKE